MNNVCNKPKFPNNVCLITACCAIPAMLRENTHDSQFPRVFFWLNATTASEPASPRSKQQLASGSVWGVPSRMDTTIHGSIDGTSSRMEPHLQVGNHNNHRVYSWVRHLWTNPWILVWFGNNFSRMDWELTLTGYVHEHDNIHAALVHSVSGDLVGPWKIL